jgi:pre-mRNA-processing factor 40
MADRERQYHKSGIKGLSPPLRDRLDPRDRHERLSSRHADQPRLSHYDRDRRERDEERVRLYRTRGEPRLARDELDYGESRSAGRRRRGADSDGESVGSGRKRARRERDDTLRRDRTPAKVIPKEEPGVHSGSEEGEMVEED